MKPQSLIGKRVHITDKESMYFEHWGYVQDYDGDSYHVSGGSIASDFGGNLTPIFDRDQFKIARTKQS